MTIDQVGFLPAPSNRTILPNNCITQTLSMVFLRASKHTTQKRRQPATQNCLAGSNHPPGEIGVSHNHHWTGLDEVDCQDFDQDSIIHTARNTHGDQRDQRATNHCEFCSFRGDNALFGGLTKVLQRFRHVFGCVAGDHRSICCFFASRSSTLGYQVTDHTLQADSSTVEISFHARFAVRIRAILLLVIDNGGF